MLLDLSWQWSKYIVNYSTFIEDLPSLKIEVIYFAQHSLVETEIKLICNAILHHTINNTMHIIKMLNYFRRRAFCNIFTWDYFLKLVTLANPIIIRNNKRQTKWIVNNMWQNGNLHFSQLIKSTTYLNSVKEDCVTSAWL